MSVVPDSPLSSPLAKNIVSPAMAPISQEFGPPIAPLSLITPTPDPVVSSVEPSVTHYMCSTLPSVSQASDSDLVMVDMTQETNGTGEELPESRDGILCERESFTTIASSTDFVDSILDGVDVEPENELISMENDESIFDPRHIDAPSGPITSNKPDPETLNRLLSCLAQLPKDTQELFVDRLVANITSPQRMKEHITKVSEVAEITAVVGQVCKNEASPEMVEGANVIETPSCSATECSPDALNIPLAAAALSAFLSKYGLTIKKQDCETSAHPSVVPIEV